MKALFLIGIFLSGIPLFVSGVPVELTQCGDYRPAIDTEFFLTQDLITPNALVCLNLGGGENKITLDCQGHSITSSAKLDENDPFVRQLSTPIHVFHVSEFHLRNCETHRGNALWVDGVSQPVLVTVDGLRAFDDWTSGVILNSPREGSWIKNYESEVFNSFVDVYNGKVDLIDSPIDVWNQGLVWHNQGQEPSEIRVKYSVKARFVDSETNKPLSSVQINVVDRFGERESWTSGIKGSWNAVVKRTTIRSTLVGQNHWYEVEDRNAFAVSFFKQGYQEVSNLNYYLVSPVNAVIKMRRAQ